MYFNNTYHSCSVPCPHNTNDIFRDSAVSVTDIFGKCSFLVETYRMKVRRRRRSSLKCFACSSYLQPVIVLLQNPGMDFSGASITGNYAGGGPELPS